MAAPRATISRRRPLHTCASSMLGIIDTAYRRSQQLNGPLGNFIKRLTPSTIPNLPFASTVQRLGLTVLSLTDDHILFFERITESVFPPSGRVFDKIDTLVYSAEGLPRRFDEALSNIPTMMHQIPFLDWVLMHVIWWLNFLVSILTQSRHTKEKEIMVDKSCDPCNSPIESPKKTTDSSGEAQERSVLSSVEFIESPVKAADTKNLDEARVRSMVSSNESVESADKEICDEARGPSMVVASNESVESEDKENGDEARGQSMVGSNEFVESADKEEARDESMVGINEFVESTDKEEEARDESVVGGNEFVEARGEPMVGSNDFVEARDESMVGSNEFVESADKEEEARDESVVGGNEFVEARDESMAGSNEFVEARDESMVQGSNEFAESTDKEEARDESMVGSTNEFVESPDSVETQEKSMLSDTEEPSSMYHETKDVESSKTEESEKKAAEDDQEHEEDQTNTNTNTDENNTLLSPAESFESAQFEHMTSPSSAANDSFHEAKSFENIELPTTDEDENKVKPLPRGNEKPSPTTIASSSGKNNAKKGKKGTGKDEKKSEKNIDEEQHKILELLEAKWHMM